MSATTSPAALMSAMYLLKKKAVPWVLPRAETVAPETLTMLSSGQFLGVFADNQGALLRNKGFHICLLCEPGDEVVGLDLPGSCKRCA
jgi:hypothetical protein